MGNKNYGSWNFYDDAGESGSGAPGDGAETMALVPWVPRERGPRDTSLSIWILVSSLVIALLVDLLLLRNHRGLNVLVVGFAGWMIWWVQVKMKQLPFGPLMFPSAVFALMTMSMFYQSDGPIDLALYPIWGASFLFYSIKARNLVFEMEGQHLDPVYSRIRPMRKTVKSDIGTVAQDTVLTGKTSQLLLGLAISIPLGGVVIYLMSSADVAFQKSVGEFFSSFEKSPSHIFWIAVIFSCCFLVTAVLAFAHKSKSKTGWPGVPALPLLSSSVILFSLILILSCFIIVHVRTLFLSEALILEETGMQLYQYVRRGFGELLAVEAILGVTLLGIFHTSQWHKEARAIHRILALVLTALAMALAVSCAVRLWCYVSEYGLSIVRHMNAVGILLSIACLLFIAQRAFRPMELNKSVGVIMQMFLVTYVLWSCAMPVRMIAWYNTNTVPENKVADIEYLRYLGPDTYTSLVSYCSGENRHYCFPRYNREHVDWVEKEKLALGRSLIEWNPSVHYASRALYGND